MTTSLNLSTKSTLLLGTSAILLLLLIFIITTYLGISKLNNLHQEIDQLNQTTRTLTQLLADENRLTALSCEFLAIKEGVTKDSVSNSIKLLKTEIDSRLNVLDNSSNLLPKQRALLKTITSELDQFEQNGGNFNALVNQGKTEEAVKFMANVQYPFYENIRLNSLELEKQLDEISDQHDEENLSLKKTVNYTLSLTGIGMILFIVLLLFSTLNTLKQIASEMRNGVNILGTSAANILSTVTEISTSAAETTTSVSETTTTVEEVRQTAMVSNQKAQSLMLSSQKAADSVDKGRDSINEVIISMKKIDNQMVLISETVLKLADQNRTISEITSSVADIADQSNLLAVNAAIEAAKAGEHGRGFTVVAQEIRSLADQSRRATAQVKEIINEINKSVNQAVGVTEQGTKTVEEGRKLVAQSGDVLESLAENVDETSQASIQISSSNQQQMAGMDQIVPAMENIKLASEQNLSGIKQAQQAAHDLNTLGHSLKEIIAKFNL